MSNEHVELVVYYQPIYSLRDNQVVSLEALVRGRTPEGRVVGALQMLEGADTPELRYALDRAVLHRACTDMTALLDRYHDRGLHGLNVNLTPTSLVQPSLDVAVFDTLEQTGLPPTVLRLEVPETAAFADLAEATDKLRRITGSGVALTLDDVGVEAIGLRYLKTLRIDGLKIDRAFIVRMLNGASDLAVVRLLVDLCAGLDIRLTAEGVERCEQVEVARSLGVRAIQGFHVARPMTLERLSEWLDAGGAARACPACFGRARSVAGATSATADGTPSQPAGVPQPGQRAAVPSE
jgi:EAL domain-containing protein (putative c-di-GMP-specific phosphodiesterase class I)